MKNGERSGRPAGGDGNNKRRILLAAREEFVAKGFRGATMRSIASRAGVDVALLAHYFGGKDALFVASTELPAGSQTVLTDALSGCLETQGERLTRGYLSLWEDVTTGAQMKALARSALSNEAATEQMRAVLTGTVGGLNTAALLAGRETGFVLAMAQLQGVALTRYLTRVPLLVELDLNDLVARIAPVIQMHLNDPKA